MSATNPPQPDRHGTPGRPPKNTRKHPQTLLQAPHLHSASKLSVKKHRNCRTKMNGKRQAYQHQTQTCNQRIGRAHLHVATSRSRHTPTSNPRDQSTRGLSRARPAELKAQVSACQAILHPHASVQDHDQIDLLQLIVELADLISAKSHRLSLCQGCGSTQRAAGVNNHQKMENGGNKTRSLVELRKAVCKKCNCALRAQARNFSRNERNRSRSTSRNSSSKSRTSFLATLTASGPACTASCRTHLPIFIAVMAACRPSGFQCKLSQPLAGAVHLLVPTFETGLGGSFSLFQGSPTCQNCRQRLRLRRLQEFTLLCADPIVASTGTSPASSPSGNAPISGCLSHQRSRS